jgi:hypothetical protein
MCSLVECTHFEEEKVMNGSAAVKEVFDQYRHTWPGFLWEMARIPGEMAILAGLFTAAIDPLGLAVLAAGVAEVAAVVHFDHKAGEEFEKQQVAGTANNDAKPAAATEPQIGDRMPARHPNAGWIYAGISKTTHEPFYVAPKDSGVFQWKAAMAFAAKDGSRLPSKEELDQIYDAKDKGALKGTFNVTGSDPAGWYWSSPEVSSGVAWLQDFSDRTQIWSLEDDDSSLRLVR